MVDFVRFIVDESKVMSLYWECYGILEVQRRFFIVSIAFLNASERIFR